MGNGVATTELGSEIDRQRGERDLHRPHRGRPASPSIYRDEVRDRPGGRRGSRGSRRGGPAARSLMALQRSPVADRARGAAVARRDVQVQVRPRVGPAHRLERARVDRSDVRDHHQAGLRATRPAASPGNKVDAPLHGLAAGAGADLLLARPGAGWRGHDRRRGRASACSGPDPSQRRAPYDVWARRSSRPWPTRRPRRSWAPCCPRARRCAPCSR